MEEGRKKHPKCSPTDGGRGSGWNIRVYIDAAAWSSEDCIAGILQAYISQLTPHPFGL